MLGLFWVTGPQESTKPGVSVKSSYSLGAPVCSRPCAPTQAGQGLTAAKLAQAVASWVSVASSSWSCIFFSSFLGAEERGPVAAGPGHCPPPCLSSLLTRRGTPPPPRPHTPEACPRPAGRAPLLASRKEAEAQAAMPPVPGHTAQGRAGKQWCRHPRGSEHAMWRNIHVADHLSQGACSEWSPLKTEARFLENSESQNSLALLRHPSLPPPSGEGLTGPGPGGQASAGSAPSWPCCRKGMWSVKT